LGKEIRSAQGVLGFLLGATLVLGLYVHLQVIDAGRASGGLGLLALPYAAVFVLPPVLLGSFAEEFRAQTHYQLLSLPVPRALWVLAKYLVVVATGIAVFVLTTALWQLALYRLDRSDTVAATTVWSGVGSVYVAALLFLTGVATAMAGLKLIIRRFQKLAMVAFFLAVLYAYARVVGWVLTGWIDPVAASLPLAPGPGAAAALIPFAVMGLGAFPGGALMLATVLFSLLLTGVGVALFEVFAEA
jgi:hypothetical protein